MNETIEFIKNTVGNSIERAYKLGMKDGFGKQNTKVTVETFVKLYEAETLKFLEMCQQDLDINDSPINQNMIIIWNGIACNVGNGATVSNHVVDGLKNFLTEDDGIDPKDWVE